MDCGNTRAIPIRPNYIRSPNSERKTPSITHQVNDELKRKERSNRKWFTDLFRRRKKPVPIDPTESTSSQEDLNQRKSFFQSRKIKNKPNNKNLIVYKNGDGFDDYVLRRDSQVILHNHNNIFNSLQPKKCGSVETSKSSHESLAKSPKLLESSSYGSLNSSVRKRRQRAQQRRRHKEVDHSSSDDTGSTTSSLVHIKSDSDSVCTTPRSDSLVNRKTRSARTERYIRRLSREDEQILNAEAAFRNRLIAKNYSSQYGSNRKPPICTNDNYMNFINNQRSQYISAPLIHPINTLQSQPTNVYSTYPKPQPPTPPPRNPNRRVLIPNIYENVKYQRPISYAFENRKNLGSTRSINSINNPPIQSTQSPVLINQFKSNSDNFLSPTTRLDVNDNRITTKYQFYTDQKPRSRKPIHIVPNAIEKTSAAQFWKQKDLEQMSNKTPQPCRRRQSASEIANCIRENVPVPAPRLTLPKSSSQHNSSQTTKTPNNLEDALNELEAIYNSLQLGDEDLLDRAERRDIPTFQNKPMPQFSSDDTSTSESCYNLNNRPKHRSRRSGIPDTVTDDMAYRKLRRNDLSPANDSALSQVSYLLASPINFDDDIEQTSTNPSEPDVTLDDVVYRNLKHLNNTLKVVEPQPPFGIPLGPITSATNSDYLHARPENRMRSRFIPQKIPDIVKDDLAFRSLRKDNCKDPLLDNDCSSKTEKKRRAARSISAELYHLIQSEENLTREDLKKCANVDDYEIRMRKSTTPPLPIKHRTTPVHFNDNDDDLSKLDKSELERMLIDLAKETQEESKKLENELNDLNYNYSRLDVAKTLNEIDTVYEQAQNCQQRLECVLNSTAPVTIQCDQVETIKVEPNQAEQIIIDDEDDELILTNHNEVVNGTVNELSIVENFERAESIHSLEYQANANEILVRNPDSPPSLIQLDNISSDCDESIVNDNKKTPFEIEKQQLLDEFAALQQQLIDLDQTRTVQGATQLQDNKSVQNTSTASILPSNSCSDNNNEDKLNFWYKYDFKTMALACAYIFACTHHLAAWDLVILIILILISILAALIVY